MAASSLKKQIKLTKKSYNKLPQWIKDCAIFMGTNHKDFYGKESRKD